MRTQALLKASKKHGTIIYTWTMASFLHNTLPTARQSSLAKEDKLPNFLPTSSFPLLVGVKTILKFREQQSRLKIILILTHSLH